LNYNKYTVTHGATTDTVHSVRVELTYDDEVKLHCEQLPALASDQQNSTVNN